MSTCVEGYRLSDGVPLHAKATSGSLALWAVVADTNELRTTPRNVAHPVLFIREQTQIGGF